MSNTIAIIGMSGRFPKSKSTDELWKNLINKKNCITKLSKDSCINDGVNVDHANNEKYVFTKGILENADKFDAELFKFPTSQALILDPQYRNMIEVAYEAIENSGYAGINKPENIGVFVGSSCMDTYYKNIINDKYTSFNPNGFFNTIYNSKDSLATLISYKLGLNGPSVSIQTACSSSLVSVCMACQSLISYDSDMALAGGVCITTPINSGYLFEQGMMLSKKGVCSSFDKNADGIVLGNGLGVVVLKRLDDAISDNDNILATIKGFATNNDGNNKIGYTAPSIEGQVKVINKALKSANIKNTDIDYIETHGTGTILGDQLELEALNKVFKSCNNISIGAIKPNIGHLDAASGIANLIKAIYILNKGVIPPNINYDPNNKHEQLHDSPLTINTEVVKKDINIASTSSFGIGGTNAHVILEKYTSNIKSEYNVGECYIPLSARTNEQLKRKKIELANFLRENKNINIYDLSYTLQVGREEFKYRALYKVYSINEIIELLESNSDCNLTNEPYISWYNGDNINWMKRHISKSCKLIPLPTYPFTRKKYWYNPSDGSERDDSNKINLLTNKEKNIENKIRNIFIKYLSDENDLREEEISIDEKLSELGFDSILSIMIKADIHKELGIKIPFNIDGEIMTIRKLCKQIVNNIENI